MVTLTWHEASEYCCTVDIHAMHFMSANGWSAIETITVAAETVLRSHVVDGDGNVHASWLVANPDLSVGGYNMKMSTYTPMVGWSAEIDGPEG